MSVAGLRFTHTAGQTSTPLETRSGSYIYNGDPAYFHDWEFRTLMRLKLYEDAIKAKAQKVLHPRTSVPMPMRRLTRLEKEQGRRPSLIGSRHEPRKSLRYKPFQ